ncbi:MAG: T9SS type A sorting domain-containing protein [Bacteroidota bacterium]
MKTSNIIVRVPEPCHEDWSSMQPDAKGKFCNSCNKSVFDFSEKTDGEIRNILVEYKDQQVCGHFRKSQVNRPLHINIHLKDFPKNISMTRAFANALFFVFGTMLFSCTDEHGQKVNEIKVNDSELIQPPDPNNFTVGMMVADVPPPLMDSVYESYSVTTGATTVQITDCFVEGGIRFEEIPEENTPVVDSVNLDEITIVEYMEPLIDPVTNYRVMSTTGLVSICTIQPDSVDEDHNTEINKSLRDSELDIYPNPSTGEFTIKYDLFKRCDVRLDVFDMKGVLIRTIVDVSNQYEGKYQIPVNLNELPNGIYLVNLIKGNKKSVERLVITR